MRNKIIILCAVLLATTFVAPSAFAAGEGGDSGWQFELAPLYLWAASIEGDAGIGPVDQEVAADFGDIFDKLESVLTGHFDARKGDWGGFFDLMYIKIGDNASLPTGGSVDARLKQTLIELAGYYRLTEGSHAFDVLAGARYTKQDTKITLSPLVRQRQIEPDWWDPIIGGRWIWGFAPSWQLVARGDIGGFGVGSDFTWNASALVIWQPWKYVSLGAGYRALDQDYEDGEGRDRYKFDATMHGPIVGVNFRW